MNIVIVTSVRVALPTVLSPQVFWKKRLHPRLECRS